MCEFIYIWWEGESLISPNAIFHGRNGWMECGGIRSQVIYHEMFGWVPWDHFLVEELKATERSHRGGA